MSCRDSIPYTTAAALARAVWQRAGRPLRLAPGRVEAAPAIAAPPAAREAPICSPTHCTRVARARERAHGARELGTVGRRESAGEAGSGGRDARSGQGGYSGVVSTERDERVLRCPCARGAGSTARSSLAALAPAFGCPPPSFTAAPFDSARTTPCEATSRIPASHGPAHSIDSLGTRIGRTDAPRSARTAPNSTRCARRPRFTRACPRVRSFACTGLAEGIGRLRLGSGSPFLFLFFASLSLATPLLALAQAPSTWDGASNTSNWMCE